MSYIKCSIKSTLFENEKKQVLTEQDEDHIYDEMAEGLIWDFLSADVRKLIHAGAAIKLGDTIEKQVAKVLKKDNKNIMKGLDLLRKAYGDRKLKLEKLRDKLFKKIDSNTAINDAAKTRFKQVIQKALDDTNEMVDALADQDDRVEAEMEPGHFDPNELSVDEQPNDTEDESPESTISKTETPKSSKEIITSLSKLNDPEKNKTFKQKMVEVLIKDGFDLLQKAMNNQNLEEELSLSDYNSLQRSSKQFIINVLGRHLQNNPDSAKDKIYRKFKSLDRKQIQRISSSVINLVVKSAANDLGEEFFGETSPESMTTNNNLSEMTAEEIAELVRKAKNEKNVDELLRLQKEVKGKDPEKWSEVGKILQNVKQNEPESLPDETPETEPDTSIEDDPVATPEPEQPESDIPIVNQINKADDILEFMLSKKLISPNVAELFKELNPENQKIVTDYAIQQITNISDSIKDIQSGALDEAEIEDLGFSSAEFSPEDLRDVRKWVKNITSNITKKIKTLHKKQKSLNMKESVSKIRENMRSLFGTQHLDEVTIDAAKSGKEIFEPGDVVWFDVKFVQKYLKRSEDQSEKEKTSKPDAMRKVQKDVQNVDAQQTNEEEESALALFKKDIMRYDQAQRKIGVISSVENVDNTDYATVNIYNAERSKINPDKLNLKPDPKGSPVKVPFELLNLIRKDELVPPEMKEFIKSTEKFFKSAMDVVKKFTPSDQDTGWTN